MWENFVFEIKISSMCMYMYLYGSVDLQYDFEQNMTAWSLCYV